MISVPQLRHLRLLRLRQLRRRIALLLQLRVAVEIGHGVGELGLIAVAVGDQLIELRLIGAWVDLREQIAGMHGLAFGEGDPDELARNLAAHDHGVVGDDRADPGEVDRHVVLAPLRRRPALVVVVVVMPRHFSTPTHASRRTHRRRLQ